MRRLEVLRSHLARTEGVKHVTNPASDQTPTVTVSPPCALVDKKVTIRVFGLQPQQLVTIAASVTENKTRFESRAVYRSDDLGSVDCTKDSSLAGTFTGIYPMGLFWSFESSKSGARFMKRDVTTPYKVLIEVFDGCQDDNDVTGLPLTTTVAERLFMSPSVRRVPLDGNPISGTLFIPEGDGPFPALLDLYGGLVTLVETRAALLASHGYVTLALMYGHGRDVYSMKGLLGQNINYILTAVVWLGTKDFVDSRRIGAMGLCYGGFLLLNATARSSKIRVLVNVNGLPILPTDEPEVDFTDKYNWPDLQNFYETDEGLVIENNFDINNPYIIPAWRNNAKILFISGGDDKQVHPKWHQLYDKHVPAKYRHNFQRYFYPGAGHLIEMPYNPCSRSIIPGRKRMLLVGVQPEVADLPLLAGGYPEQHAFAQEDSWNRILKFLSSKLRS